MRGVEQVRVGRRQERGDRSFGVAFVAAQYVGENVGLLRALAVGAKLEEAAPRARLRLRGDEDLHVGAGADHRADVAAIEHCARPFGGEIALERHQRGAHVGYGGDDRGGLADRVALQLLVERRRIEPAGGLRRMGAIVEAVGRARSLVGEIHASADEQTAAISQINDTIANLDAVTQRNAAMASETRASASTLRRQAQVLGEAVSVFHMDGKERDGLGGDDRRDHNGPREREGVPPRPNPASVTAKRPRIPVSA